MNRPAELAGSMRLPVESVNVAALKKALTLTYQPVGADEPSILHAFRIQGSYICVPRQFGISYCQREGIEFIDCTSAGVPVKFPKVATPRDYQVEPLKLISNAFDSYYDFLFRARTGWGKTLGSLIAAARIGVSTLIVVDQENLKDQWIKALTDKNFFGFNAEDIGIVQGKKCRYKGCAVTIAMVQTLSKKDFPQDMYDYFGLLIVDEVHIIGAPTFSTVLLQFSAMYRLGVSATPKRRDGLQKVLDYNLGRVRVYVADEHSPSSVYVLEHDSVYTWYANSSPKMGRFINEIAADASRNLLASEAIAFLYDSGRDVLVLSDRIEHLREMLSLCYYGGIPQEEMGIYAGYTPSYGYGPEPTPSRRPDGYVRGLEYTPVSLQLISKRNSKPVLQKVKDTAKVIFATYGMFSKGVDVPRLGGGVDITPRSQAEQMQGRILRSVDGKQHPIWITIVDTQSYRSVNALAGRVPDYARNNADIYLWKPDKGLTLCDPNELKKDSLTSVKSLKSMQIETNSDGLNTLTTQRQQIEHVRRRVSATKRADPRRDD